MAGSNKPITDQERAERQARIARAVGSVRLEGLESLSDETVRRTLKKTRSNRG